MTTEPQIEGTPLIAPSSTDHPLYDQIVEACRSVFDPEIPVNIYDLGLVYTIAYLLIIGSGIGLALVLKYKDRMLAPYQTYRGGFVTRAGVLALAAIALGAVARALSTGSRSATMARRQLEALHVARGELEDLKAGRRSVESSRPPPHRGRGARQRQLDPHRRR